MKVLHVMASPGDGGLERVFADLSNRLASLCEVVVMTPEGAEALKRIGPGVTGVETLPRGSRRNPRTILALSRAIRRIGPDLVHSHAAKAAEVVHWSLLGLDVPHLATKHNVKRRRIFDRVPRVAAVSRAVARSVPGRERTTVVYNGIEPLDPAPDRVLPEVFTIVSVGRLHPVKGFDRLIEESVRLETPCAVRIVGEGSSRGRLQALVDGLDVADRVELLGQRDDVPELLARSHVQVVASGSEGFGLTLVEGLFYANALLSTPVGIAPEILPPSMLVERGSLTDALRRTRDGYPEARARLDALRAEVAPLFTMERTAAAYLDLYRSSLAGR